MPVLSDHSEEENSYGLFVVAPDFLTQTRWVIHTGTLAEKEVGAKWLWGGGSPRSLPALLFCMVGPEIISNG